MSFKDQFSKQNNCAHNATITLILIDRKVSMRKVSMKKLIAVFATALLSASVQAEQPTWIGASNVSNFYVISSSFVRHSDKSISAMFEDRNKKTQRSERGYFGMMESDCARGFGTLYFKEHYTSEWVPNIQFALAGNTVGDQIATVLCGMLSNTI